MKRFNFRSLLLVVAALAAFAGGIGAQVTGGAVTGTVVDPNGAVVSGATVVLKDTSRGLEFKVETTSAGSYQFPNVQTGTYTMTVTASGFSPATGEIVVSLNQTATANMTLSITGSTAVVNVTGDADTIVQTDTSQVGSTFTERQFQDLPVGQNPNNLALLAPNVTAPPIGVSGAGAITGGLRQRANSFTIDGVDNNDNGVSGSIRGVINDSVGEFSFLQNNFNAEFSSGGAGQFNTITKSGTNTYHGSVFGYWSSEKFNSRATNEDGTDKRRARTPQYGGTIGGPLPYFNFGKNADHMFRSGKDKLFFFVAYEKDRFGGEGSALGSFLAPTAAGLAAIAARPGASPFAVALLKTGLPLAPTQQFVNCDPLHPTPDDFPILGACNIGFGIISPTAPNSNETKSYQVNIDHSLNSKNQFRYRLFKTEFTSIDAVTAPAFASNTSQKQTSFSANWISNFTPNLINDFRFGYIKSETLFNQLVDQSQFNFPVLDLDLLGTAVGPADQQTDTKKTWQYYDSMTWIAGKHAFKFGGEYLNRPNSIFFLPRHGGEYEYGDLDRFFMDLKPDLFNHKGIGDPVQPLASRQMGGFVQDDWKVTHNLTLNLGVRWDYQSIYEVEKLQALSAPANIPGLVEFGVPKADKDNFAPRVGFAWAPSFDSGIGHLLFGKSGESSIRANFARSYFIAFSNLVSAGPPAALQGELVDAGPATGFLQSGGASNAPYVFNNSAANIRAVTGSLILDHVSPYADAYAVSYQRQLGRNLGMEIRFLRTNGRSLFVQVQTNSRTVADDAMVVPTLFAVPTAAALGALPTIGTIAAASPTLAGATAANKTAFQANRQVPEFAGVLTADPPIGKSRYNGLSFSVNRHFANHFSASAAYTFSHTWDNSFNELFTSDLNPRRSQDVGEFFKSGLDIAADWAPSIADVPHRFVASWVYEVPFKSNNAFFNGLIGGWELTGIFQAQSGQLVDIQSGVDSNRNGDGAGDRALFNPNGDPTLGSGVIGLYLDGGVVKGVALGGTPNPNVRAYLPGTTNATGAITSVKANAGWIQTGFFAKELANGGAGTAPRNAYRTRAFNNTDMVLLKTTPFGHEGRFKFQVGAEAHDVFNQRARTIAGLGANARSFVLPNTVQFLNYNFGTYSGRSVTLRAKFIF